MEALYLARTPWPYVGSSFWSRLKAWRASGHVSSARTACTKRQERKRRDLEKSAMRKVDTRYFCQNESRFLRNTLRVAQFSDKMQLEHYDMLR